VGADEGVVAEGVVAEGVVAEGVVAEGVVAEGVVAEGVVAEGEDERVGVWVGVMVGIGPWVGLVIWRMDNLRLGSIMLADLDALNAFGAAAVGVLNRVKSKFTSFECRKEKELPFFFFLKKNYFLFF